MYVRETHCLMLRLGFVVRYSTNFLKDTSGLYD